MGWGGGRLGNELEISPLVFTFLIARFGWRAGFGISGILTVLLAIAWWLSTRGMFDHPGYAPRTSGRERPVRLFNRDLLLLTAAYGATNYFEYIFFYWLYYYFSVVRHTGAEQSAIYTTAVWLAWAVMTPVGGWISDRLVHAFGGTRGRRIIAMTALSLSAILVFLATSRQNSAGYGFAAMPRAGLRRSHGRRILDRGGRGWRLASGGCDCNHEHRREFGVAFWAPVLTPCHR